MKAALIIGAAFLLAACQSPEPGFHSSGLDTGLLDCKIGFQANVRAIKNRPMIEPYEGEHTSSGYHDRFRELLFIVTQPDHPAHPAIFMRSVAVTTESINFLTEACGYGDRDALNEAVGRYRAFDKLLDAEHGCSLCSNHLVSPTVEYVAATEFVPPPS